ncbi:GATA zinc finger domain-containing 1 [Brachionus plicatilis]|uniref:GATA zinc finger domain-containing protein 1 n=1 Tax=Brachionus plicatilis TaxID=10195 RepID=A0A3M7RQQ3_BRAPC|nr:GATA zinc finger domain-containing 1 [Brachionus plicatilis]
MKADSPCDKDVKMLLYELISRVAVEELHDFYDLNESNLKQIRHKRDIDESVAELDEHFRHIEELVTDELNSFYFSNEKCDACKTNFSPFWRRVTRNKIVCNDCFFEKAYLILFDDDHLSKRIKLDSSSSSSSKQTVKNKNKKTLGNQKLKGKPASNRPLTRTNKTQLSSCSLNEDMPRKSARLNQESESDCSRRNKLFKSRPPVRNQIFVSKINTSDYVFHRGFYMQVGDIVALRDKDDLENIYFAQIRAFLSDQYGQKSAVITWLIPVSENFLQIRYLKDFDPSLFELGPAEDFPRSLDCMEFVARLDHHPQIKSGLGYFNYELKFKNDLLRHKFNLEDLAMKNFRFITNSYSDKNSDIRTEIGIE